MEELICNLLRGSVTSIMNVILLFTLTKTKFSHGSTIIASVLVLIISMGSIIWFYVYGDLTALSRFNVVMFIGIGLALKPLTRISFMQWTFTYLTTINIMMVIIFLSFQLGKAFPHPQIANILLRLVFYIIVLILFKQFLLPLYQSMVKNWPVFSALVICIFCNFTYYFYFTDDIQMTLLTSKWPLYLLVLLSLTAYGTVFFSLKRFTAMHEIETENLKIQNDAGLLYQAASALTDRLQLMDEAAHAHNLASHDRRHFNSMILSLLEQGEIEEAKGCLLRQNTVNVSRSRVYCENKAVNAVVSYYADKAAHSGIETVINLTVPAQMGVDSMELALVVSNLFENAIKGISLLPEEQERFIRLTCLETGRLLLEIVNPCSQTVALGTDGYPYTNEDGHGIGTKSIIAFASKHDAELLYHVENGLFRVRLLI
ncbi:MAG: GHKL domain-containing protein [Spirochaetia bacterium]|nr:GHKL domain-containing protein [Spirochaetia bacterium]